MQYRHLVLAASALAVTALSAQASIAINLLSGIYRDQAGSPVAEGTLFQLVNLGADGIFNDISLSDGNISATGQWVSGDDALITASYLGSAQGASDYATLGGFDLVRGNVPDFPGFLNRTFFANISELPGGTKIGIRWFPGLTAANYYLPGSITLASGQRYGQFTRQNDPIATGPLYDGSVNGGDLWISPAADGADATFDPFLSEQGGNESTALGQASKTIPAVPEPATAVLALFGAAGLFTLRRRRS